MRLIGLAGAFALLSAIFAVVERISPAIAAQPRWRRDSRTDLAYWFVTPLVSKACAKGAALVAVIILGLAIGVRPGELKAWAAHRPHSHLALPLQALLILFIGDLIGYWRHRLFHGRLLWKFHAVHHSSRELDWLSSVRLHPVDEIAGFVLQAVPLFFLGFSPALLVGYVPLLTFYAIFVHANATFHFGPLRFVVATPAFHRWHHTAQEEGLDRNFAGFFPMWDLLFGTYYLPHDRVATRFGVLDDAVPDGIVAQLLYPFRSSAR